MDQLATIPGLGEAKIEKYGEAFIAVIEPKSLAEKTLSETELESLSLLNQGLTVQDIANARGLKTNTVQTHLATAIELNVCELSNVVALSSEEIESINQQVIALNTIEDGALKPLYEYFEQRYDYGTLKCVVAKMLANSNAVA
ncbi:ATP-dependent DNA helicase RecQ [Vibrio variabilis]|uniref:ATP-dependent DNA helicase RecQ n=1 Tax=Vibrio variabilis TaxID=990271 RepID=A0ABQ0JP27_9VIBR|nr:ATP-dependent DNA helicase RecQ [Vibrio variabilis]